MGAIREKFEETYRDFALDGVKSSGEHNPDKADQRALGPLIESAIANAGLGALVDVVYATRAELDADLAHDADSVALVTSDPADANNDLYTKTGASGAGAWTLTTAFHDLGEQLLGDALSDLAAAVARADALDLAISSWSGVPATVEHGFFYDRASGAKTANVNWRAFKVAVDESKGYRVSTLLQGSSNSTAGVIYFASDASTVLGYELPQPGSGVFTQVVDYALTLPAGTAFVAVTAYRTNEAGWVAAPSLEEFDANSFGNSVINLIGDVDAAREWRAIDGITTPSTYYDRDANVIGNINYNTTAYAITGYEKSIRASFSIIASGVMGVAYLDANGDTIGVGYSKDGAGQVDFVNEVLDVPATARTIVLSSRASLTPPKLEVLSVPFGETEQPPLALGVIFGDSITNTVVFGSGSTVPGDNSNATATSWVSYAMPAIASDWRNFAEGGASYLFRSEETATDPFKNGWHQVDQAIAAGIAPDVIIFALGANDVVKLNEFETTRTLGDLDTAMGKAIGALDGEVLYEAIRYCLHKSAEEWPDAHRFVMTPIQSANATFRTHALMAPVITAIEEVAAYYGFEVIDQYRESGIVRDFEVDGANGQDLSDGTHPYENVGEGKGVAKMARLVRARVLERAKAK